MNLFTKSITCLIIFLIIFLIPVYSLALSEVEDLSFTKLNNGKTEIKIDSTGEFLYFITASKNNLIINLKNAIFADELINMMEGKSIEELKIKGLVFENISKNLSKLIIQLDNLNDFKFVMNTKNGIAAPYGFNSKVKVKKGKHKLPEKKSTSFQPPQIVKQKETINILEEVKKPVKTDSNSNNNNFDPYKAGDEVSLIQPVFPKNCKKHNKKRKITRNNSSSKIRLDSTSVYVPPNYSLYEEKKQIIQHKEAKKNPVVTDNPTYKRQEKTKKAKPIPSDELLKRLSSSNTEINKIPRLTPTAITTDIKKNNNTTVKISTLNNNLNSPKTTSKNAIKIQPLPKGRVINVEGKIKRSTLQNKPKVIEVSNSDNSDKSELIALEKGLFDKNLLKPRDIDSLPLGLNEEIENYSTESTVFKIPEPKPTYTSDGAIAFTVISSEGVINAKAPVRNINTNDTQALGVLDNRIIENSQENYNFVRQQFKKLIQKANNFYQSGHFDQAENAYQKAINLDSNLPWGHLALASFYETQNRYNDAIEEYEKALKALPNRVEIIYNQALNYYKLGKTNQAIDKLLNVITLSPDFTLAYYNIGTLYYMEGKYNKAIKYLNMAIERNPVLVDAHFNMGLSKIAKKDYANAQKNFKDCLEIDPDDSACLQIFKKLKNL